MNLSTCKRIHIHIIRIRRNICLPDKVARALDHHAAGDGHTVVFLRLIATTSSLFSTEGREMVYCITGI